MNATTNRVLLATVFTMLTIAGVFAYRVNHEIVALRAELDEERDATAALVTDLVAVEQAYAATVERLTHDAGAVAETMGSIEVLAPIGTRVFIDGQEQGAAPLRMNAVGAGRHVVSVVLANGSLPPQDVEVLAGRVATVTFESPRSRTSLRITVHPDDAADVAVIVLDGRVMPGSRFSVPPGHHSLAVTAPGFQHWIGSVDIDPGETESLVVTLEPR